MPLETRQNLPDPDCFYQKLIALHSGRCDEESRLINASLVLLLANHIGDMEVLDEAIGHAAATAEHN